MRLRHEQANSVLRTNRHTFGESLKTTAVRAWRSAKRFGAGLLVAGLITAPCAGAMVGCADNQTNHTQQGDGSQIPKTATWREPYKGKVSYDENGNPYMANRFIVTFTKQTNRSEVESLIRDFAGRITGQIPSINMFEIETKDIEVGIAAMSKADHVDFSNRNYYFKTETASEWDNDTYTGNNSAGLWWTDKIQLAQGTNLFDSLQVTLRPTTIAVIDVGFNLGSPSPGQPEIPYVDSVYHFDFGDWDTNVHYDINHSYGTNVSSFIAAINNGFRTNGVASLKKGGTFKILPLKIAATNPDFLRQVVDNTWGIDDVWGDVHSWVAALEYVRDNRTTLNISVVNLSIGIYLELPKRLPMLPPQTSKIIGELIGNGVILVAAAGNNNQNLCSGIFESIWSRINPGSLPGIIAVGATEIKEDEEKRASFSNFSDREECLTVVAPGAKLLVFDRSGNPYLDSGTSYSSPIVAGLVAVMKSINPYLTNEEIVRLLKDNADGIILNEENESVPEARGTWKRINVYATLRAMLQEEQPHQCYLVKKMEHAGDIPHSLFHTNLKLTADKLLFNVYDVPGTPAQNWYVYDLITGQISPSPFGAQVWPFNSDLAYLDDKIIYKDKSQLKIMDRQTGQIKVIEGYDMEGYDGATKISVREFYVSGDKILIGASTDIYSEASGYPYAVNYVYDVKSEELTRLAYGDWRSYIPRAADIDGNNVLIDYYKRSSGDWCEGGGQPGRNNLHQLVLTDISTLESRTLLSLLPPHGCQSDAEISRNYLLYSSYDETTAFLRLYNLVTAESRVIAQTPYNGFDDHGDVMQNGLDLKLFMHDMDEGRMIIGMNYAMTLDGSQVYVYDPVQNKTVTLWEKTSSTRVSGVSIQGRKAAFISEYISRGGSLDPKDETSIYLCNF
ncbi:MAG: S8/S53 family peptidase [Candidatus Micrarchaeota archaeon]